MKFLLQFVPLRLDLLLLYIVVVNVMNKKIIIDGKIFFILLKLKLKLKFTLNKNLIIYYMPRPAFHLWNKVKKGLLPGLYEKQQFNKKMKTLNTKIYRTKMKIKKGEKMLSLDNDMFVDSKKFASMKIISNPEETASGSLVYLLTKKDGAQFVLKITRVERGRAVNLNFPDSEAKMYQIMNKLVEKDISPHMFLGIETLKNIRYRDLKPNLKALLDAYPSMGKEHFYVLLNETGDKNVKIRTLYNTIEKISLNVKSKYLSLDEAMKILYNILFQILYTLEVYNRIGVKHNDLHTNNIFVLVREKNFIDTIDVFSDSSKAPEKFYRTYKYRHSDGTLHELNLPNLGFDVRIYDFDRTCKLNLGVKNFKEEIKPRFIADYSWTNTNCSRNISFDTYKVLAHFYHQINYRGNPLSFKGRFAELLQKLILQSSIILTDKDASGRKISNKYYLLSRQLRPDEMLRTEDMLVILEDDINKLTNRVNYNGVVEIYSMEYLITTLKEKRYKALEAKAFGKKLLEQKTKLKKTKKVKFSIKKSKGKAKTKTIKVKKTKAPAKAPGGGAPAPPKKCPEGQEYVPVKGKCMANCKPGKVRNPTTGRCIISRKAKANNNGGLASKSGVNIDVSKIIEDEGKVPWKEGYIFGKPHLSKKIRKKEFDSYRNAIFASKDHIREEKDLVKKTKGITFNKKKKIYELRTDKFNKGILREKRDTFEKSYLFPRV